MFPRVIAEIIADYAAKYVLSDWVIQANLCNPCGNIIEIIDWFYLSRNPNAIDLIEENPDRIDWGTIWENPAAIHILEKNMDKVNWERISYNSGAKNIIRANPDKVDWGIIERYSWSTDLLEEFPNKMHKYSVWANPDMFDKICNSPRNEIVWEWLAMNPNPKAIKLLFENPNEFNEFIYNFSSNTSPIAIKYFEENLDKINWQFMSENRSGIELLRSHPSKIDRYYIEDNPAAIELLHEDPNTFPGTIIWGNPMIFEPMSSQELINLISV